MRIWRYRAYFLRGHAQWLSMPLWFLNTIIIQYQLFFYHFIDNILIFSIPFVIIYPVIAILIGRWDYTSANGPYRIESSLLTTQNPKWVQFDHKLDLILKNQERP